jgi:hypothetical protein
MEDIDAAFSTVQNRDLADGTSTKEGSNPNTSPQAQQQQERVTKYV